MRSWSPAFAGSALPLPAAAAAEAGVDSAIVTGSVVELDMVALNDEQQKGTQGNYRQLELLSAVLVPIFNRQVRAPLEPAGNFLGNERCLLVRQLG